ncbi:hypothetical protein C8Q72DRAFT_977596 [Fomitopsis betulina]|nr:hypothetical protein C8Q72DRAFT_977596 [Fomitopsis betulina]
MMQRLHGQFTSSCAMMSRRAITSSPTLHFQVVRLALQVESDQHDQMGLSCPVTHKSVMMSLHMTTSCCRTAKPWMGASAMRFIWSSPSATGH